MPSLIREQQVYRTNDLALAAVLALTFPLEALDRSQPSGAVLLFRRDAYLDDLVTQYGGGELRVEPQAYYQLVRALESRVSGELLR